MCIRDSVSEDVSQNLSEPLSSQEKQSLAQKIEAKYGSPDKQHPVSAIKDAPAPFKAMIEALDGGDRYLAFKYAVKYADYTKRLTELNGSAMGMLGNIDVMKGDLSDGSWADSPEYAEEKALMIKYQEEKRKEKGVEEKPTSRNLKLSKAALAEIRRAEKSLSLIHI